MGIIQNIKDMETLYKCFEGKRNAIKKNKQHISSSGALFHCVILLLIVGYSIALVIFIVEKLLYRILTANSNKRAIKDSNGRHIALPALM